MAEGGFTVTEMCISMAADVGEMTANASTERDIGGIILIPRF